MKKLLVIIVIFIGVRELIVVSRNFVDNHTPENIQPEKIDPRNVHIGFNKLEERNQGKQYNVVGCSIGMHLENDEEIDVTTRIGMFNYSSNKGSLFITREKPHIYISLIPDPTRRTDMHWGDVITWLLLYTIGLDPKSDIGWLRMVDSLQENVFYEDYDIPLTQENTSLLDKVMIDEEPFIVGFTWLTFEEKSGFGMTWWHIANKQVFAFEVDPKGLIKQEDKEKYLTCKAQILQRK